MNSPLVNAFTLALLHFVWQGAIITALAAAGLRLIGGQSAKARYAFACALLLAMPIVVMITTLVEWRSADAAMLQTFVRDASVPPAGLSVALPASSQTASAPAQQMPMPAKSPYQVLGAWVLPIWLLGVAILCGYRAASWIAAQRLRRRAVCAATPEWRTRLNQLVRQLRISRPVTMLESSLTDTPLTMGVLRPVVLLPIGLLAGLPVEQIELILLHELAHIRRHDYLVNLLQTAIESLLFYHPGVWWLSRRIRMEREYCCDDIVVSATGNVTAYARMLTELEQRRAVFSDAVLAATGGNLMFRIQRLLGRPAAPKGAMSGPLAIVLLLASCAALYGWQGKSFTPAPQNAVAQVQAGSPQSAQGNGTPAGADQSADQPKDKREPRLRPNSFFEAIHARFWNAVVWFHQLIGIAPPKHTAATHAPQPPSAPPSSAEAHEVSQAAPSSPTAASDKAKVASTSLQDQIRALEQRRAEMERQRKVQTEGPIAQEEPVASPLNASSASMQDQIERLRLTVERAQQAMRESQRKLQEEKPGAAPPDASSASMQDRIERLRDAVERAQQAMRAQFVQAQFQADPPATPYQKWLNEEVDHIITDSERTAFQQLQTDNQRQAFIEQFWLRRDPTPGTEKNEFRDEYYRRIMYANTNFASGTSPGWKSDRGMFYIRYGAPDEITSRRVNTSDGTVSPVPTAFEVWHYKFIEGVGHDVEVPFAMQPDGGYKLSWGGLDASRAMQTEPELRGQKLFQVMGRHTEQ